MKRKLNCIMLIDDNRDDNYFHSRVIKKSDCANEIVVAESGKEAIEYLKSQSANNGMPPDLIFLDINMPGMDGWEFLEVYDKLDTNIKSKVIVNMLTTSDNPDDILKAQSLKPVPLKDYKTKPLTKEMLAEIIDKYFLNNSSL